ncbi:MAG: hypothetical protein LBG11_08180, partial [Bifidobacteriaceae bacterium]|nr:hypothetical protein [Bifidobacteriaceae bacterium]
MAEEQPQLDLELPPVSKRAPRRATKPQSAPDLRALDQLVDLTEAVAKHSERLGLTDAADKTDPGEPTKQTAGKSSTGKRAKGRARPTEPKAPAGQPPAPVGDGVRLPMTALLFQAPVVAAASARSAVHPEAEGEPAKPAQSRSSRRRAAAKAGKSPTNGEAEKAADAQTASGKKRAQKPALAEATSQAESAEESEESGSRRRRKRIRTGRKEEAGPAENEGVTALAGSTRLEAKRQRRKEGRETGRRRTQITEAEFLARRESVDRRMVVRERDGRTQIAVLEDGVLVEHYVARRTQHTMVGSVYLGRVQNVLPSMEAAFVDVGRGRNAVLYAG